MQEEKEEQKEVVDIPTQEEQKETNPSEPKPSPLRYNMGEERRGGAGRKILLILLVLLLVGGAVAGVIFVGGQNEEEVATTPTPTQAPTSTPTPEVSPSPTGKTTPTPTPTKKPTKGLSVRVLNGSGATGAAKQAADYLANLGYEIVSVGNASSTDFENTTIEIKKAKESLLAQLKIDLETKYTVGTTSADLSTADSADAVVTVGKK